MITEAIGRMLSSLDIQRQLTTNELDDFLSEIEGWSASYALLANAMAKKNIVAEIVLAKSIQLDVIRDFRNCPHTPLINSQYSSIRDYYFNKIKAFPFGSTILAMNYQYDIDSAKSSNIIDLGGKIENVSGDPLFLFEKNKSNFLSVDSFRDNFFSPVILSVEPLNKFDKVFAMYCNVMNDETIIYLEADKIHN